MPVGSPGTDVEGMEPGTYEVVIVRAGEAEPVRTLSWWRACLRIREGCPRIYCLLGAATRGGGYRRVQARSDAQGVKTNFTRGRKIAVGAPVLSDPTCPSSRPLPDRVAQDPGEILDGVGLVQQLETVAALLGEHVAVSAGQNDRQVR